MLGRFERFCNAISAIHLAIQKIERDEMAKYDLKGAHAQYMLIMGQHPEGITAAQLCTVCEKDKAAISRAVAELEEAGMIVRRDPDGKRYRSRLFLTEKGAVVAEDVSQTMHHAVSMISQGYDVEQREIFVNVLNRIAGNLQTLCREGL